MDTLALITFDSEAKAYQGLSELKHLVEAGAIELEEAAVVQRDVDKGLIFKDAVGFDPSGASTGSIIGMLVGLLAGPIGLLFGWLTGGLIGASADASRAADATSSLSYLGSRLPVGGTALIAALHEPTADAVNALVRRLGGEIVRQPADEVQQAIAAARRAEVAAREAARKSLNERKEGIGHSKWQEAKSALKRAFTLEADADHK
jgi:uncharacterized membrane protein